MIFKVNTKKKFKLILSCLLKPYHIEWNNLFIVEQTDYISLQKPFNLPSHQQINEYLLPAKAHAYFIVLQRWLNFPTNCLFYNYSENFVHTALYDKTSFQWALMYHLCMKYVSAPFSRPWPLKVQVALLPRWF